MKKIIFILIGIVILIGVMGGVFFVNRISGTEETTTSVFNVKRELKNDLGVTNVLIIGVDTRDKKYLNTGTLTDTMIVASINKNTKTVKLISIPRDLWVSYGSSSSKINEVYTRSDIDTLKNTISELLGVSIHYNAKVDFNTAVKFIDELGGVTVSNPVSFTDYRYPKFGWENETCGIDVEALEKEKEEQGEVVTEEDFPCRFEVVTFEKGDITLDGENALKYARSRHSIDNSQGNDFARASRQHLIIKAVRDKLLSTNTLTDVSKLKALYGVFSEALETDFTLNDVLLAYRQFGSEISDYEILSAVLSDSGEPDSGGVLVRGNPDLYNGLYVLVPANPDSIKSFVNSYFYGE